MSCMCAVVRLNLQGWHDDAFCVCCDEIGIARKTIFSASSLLVLPVRWPMICKQEKRPAVRVPPAFQREEKKKEGVSFSADVYIVDK